MGLAVIGLVVLPRIWAESVATDELGFRAVQDRVHVNDVHATILKLLGLNHEKLTFLFQGRNMR